MKLDFDPMIDHFFLPSGAYSTKLFGDEERWLDHQWRERDQVGEQGW